MSSLVQRIQCLEAQAGLDGQQCPEHWTITNPSLPIDYRAMLAPFSPDTEERVRYEAERQAQRCAKCGWEPIQILVSDELPDQGQVLE
jgi:hypothetical protein